MEFVVDKVAEEEQTRGIFSDILKYAPSKFVGFIGNALIVPIYTNLLLPEQYGVYSVSIALLSFLCILFSDWVGLSGLRFFRKHQLIEDLPNYITTLVSILTFNLLLMFGLGYLFKGYICSFFNIPIQYFFAILFLIIPVAIRALLFQLIRAQLKSLSFTLSTILNQFMTIGLSVFFVKMLGLGAYGMLLGMGVSITLIDLLLIYQSNIIKWFRLSKVRWNFFLPIFVYGIPIAATALSTWVVNQSNKFIMSGIKGFSEAGIVGVGYGLTLPLLLTVFSLITVAVIPRIYNMYEERIDFRPILSKFVGYYLLISLPIITVISLYSGAYVEAFANAQFYNAYKLIPYFSFGTFFLALTDYTTLQYHLANKTYIEFILKLVSGITCVVLNILLIPSMGLVGVGIATLSANFVYFLLSVIITLPDFRIKLPIKVILQMLLSFVILFIVYYCFLKICIVSPLIQALALLFVYYGIYYLIDGKFGFQKSS